mgnify:FL=1
MAVGFSGRLCIMEYRGRTEGGAGMEKLDVAERLLRRDESGMQDLLRHYGPLMRYVIAPIVTDSHEQEDCLSEAAMRVWDKIGQFDPQRGSWTAWLTAVARSTALNHVRGQRRDRSAGALEEDMPSPTPTPEETVLRRERQQEVRQALDWLPAEEQALFYRKYYYLQPTAQIAAELGTTERAVEGRLYRLKKKLRRWLGGEPNA